MTKNIATIAIGFVGALAIYAFFATINLISELIGEGTTIIISVAIMAWVGRLMFRDLFVDVDDE